MANLYVSEHAFVQLVRLHRLNGILHEAFYLAPYLSSDEAVLLDTALNVILYMPLTDFLINNYIDKILVTAVAAVVLPGA